MSQTEDKLMLLSEAGEAKQHKKLPLMVEGHIGQRLNFSIKELAFDAIYFCKALDTGDSIVRSYFNRGSKPNTGFIKKLSKSVESFNLNWLLTEKDKIFLHKGY
jgi:hypothetical protein